jgi:hypothetical protein
MSVIIYLYEVNLIKLKGLFTCRSHWSLSKADEPNQNFISYWSEVLNVVNNTITVSEEVILCSLMTDTDVSEERPASIF